jgi:hypothetical protein
LGREEAGGREVSVNRTYILEIEIDTGNNEFWEEIGNRSGRKEVKEEVKNCLAEHGFFAPQCRVKVIEVLTRSTTSGGYHL